MIKIPVTIGVMDDTVVGYLSINEEIIPGDQLKDMHISWGFNSRENRVVQAQLLPPPSMSVNMVRQILEGDHHEFDPFGYDWALPRCKVCSEFEAHRLHCTPMSVEGGPDICKRCSEKAHDYVIWNGHTDRERMLIWNLAAYVEEMNRGLT